ncbi:MAG: hypothetical protein NUW12_08715 [Firmicutes bacterium]|jgi:hypothetical protein|nr:hypothetical protein [Bacillota bacterium]MDH7496071.1 hypothetical protein [Bacillota bacterium]
MRIMSEQAGTMHVVGARLVFHCVFRFGMNQHFLVIEDQIQNRLTIVVVSPEEFAFLRRIGVPECNVIEPMMPGTPGMPGSGGLQY